MTSATTAWRATGCGPAPVPKLWWLAGAVYLLLMAWLALRTRVYIDQVWIVEYGRRLLGDGHGWSMYMRPDGSSPLTWSWLGVLLAELSFRLAGLWPFRLLMAVAALVAALSLARLAQRFGATPGLAALTGGALLLDPSLLQSVQLGRADALALALLFAGMLLATRGADRLRSGSGGWRLLAVGYGLCALAPAAWTSALLLGPLAALHLAATWRTLAREAPVAYTHARAALAFLLVPALVFVVAVVIPAWRSRDGASAGDSAGLLFDSHRSLAFFLRLLAEEFSVSVALVIAGLAALLMLRPRWLAGLILVGIAICLLSGFYQFRVPYVMAWLATAAALYSAQVSAAGRAEWTRLLALALAVAIALFGVRLGLALVNQPPPAAAPWFAGLPRDARIADYSWDFYETARRDARPVMRSMPLIDDAAVVAWVRRTRPDFIVSAIDPESTWMLVFDPDAVFAESGYCRVGDIDWGGNPAIAEVARRPPSPLLWKLGRFRDHGPYRVLAPCERIAVPEG